LSVAVKLSIATVKDVAVDGMLKLPTAGGVVSGSVIVTLALRLAETFPAASFVHAYKVFVPAVEKL
jgi:hypothetical protein